MKRLTYISNFSRDLDKSEIDKIAEKSEANNAQDGLTGALFCFRNMFYQILEGDEEKLDTCFARISKDERHTDIFILKIELDVEHRNYPDWGMKTVALNEQNEPLMRPIRNMLDSISQTHSILRKYAPVEVLTDIQHGLNPLVREPQLADKVVMFSDIFNSTTLTENLPIKEMSRLLDTYYDIANTSILKHGGFISKLTGDGLMAYFDESRAQSAIESALEILLLLKRARVNDTRWGRYLYAGFGMTLGTVYEGNIGSPMRKDYTVLGDSVNTAARLESLTRRLETLLVVDENVARKVEGVQPVKKLGIYQPKGKLEKIKIFTIDRPQVWNKNASEMKASLYNEAQSLSA